MTKTRTGGSGLGRKKGTGRGRPRRGTARHRKQLVVDVALLGRAMEITGRNQSDTVNEALARLTENAAIIDGVERLRGAFPDHPDHRSGR